METEQRDRLCLEIGRGIMDALELSKASVDEAMMIAEGGTTGMLRQHLETMVERSLIVGHRHGMGAYSTWQYFKTK